MSHPLRIAMWSGPRNMSTTMMRSFGARADTSCVDEPFYAAYLSTKNIVHPMQNEILAAQSSDPAVVADQLVNGTHAAPIFYQKQMTHHILDSFPTEWMRDIHHHVFLIRHPARVIASYARKMETMTLEAMGFPQQSRIAETVSDLAGRSPIVVDSDDVLRNPEGMMKSICKALDIAWDEAMLNWTAGSKAEDGAWAPHWYDKVNASTGFGPPPGPLPQLTGSQADHLEAALPLYDALWEIRLQA